MFSSKVLSSVFGGCFFFFLLFGLGDGFNKKYSQMIMWYKSKDKNDNSENLACHNYAHNLMMTAEPNAIFMTEGGDNQVFSLLYFSYVEKKRPDIDFYDQKGNVFPRLYGDLMNVFVYDLNIIRALRDFQLYSTGRPVYLTWKRDDIENISAAGLQEIYENTLRKAELNRSFLGKKYDLTTLHKIEQEVDTMVPKATFDMKFKNGDFISQFDFKEKGPWFFKNYGLLYKLVPLRYSILEALKSKKQASYSQIVTYINQILDFPITALELKKQIRLLETEGYISENGSRIFLLKSKKDPFNKDYWKSYQKDFTNVANANQWDYLTREIFYNYFVHEANDLLQKKNLLVLEKPALFDNLILPLENQIETLYESACHYAHDVKSAFYFYARFTLDQGNLKKATSLFSNCANVDYNFFDPYITISRLYLQESLSSPLEEEQKYLLIAQENIQEAKKIYQKRARVQASLKNIEKERNYQTIKALDQQISNLIQFPRKFLKQLIKNAKQGRVKDLEALFIAYQKRADFFKANKIINQILQKNPFNIYYTLMAYNFFTQYDISRAITFLEKVIANYSFYKGKKPSIFDFQERCASDYLRQAENSLSTQDYKQALYFYRRSLHYMNLFKEFTFDQRTNPSFRKRIITIERTERLVENRIKRIESLLSEKKL